MPAHKHAALMALYAQDAAETDKPWEWWEMRLAAGPWVPMTSPPLWHTTLGSLYRRKPQKKAVDLSVLIDSGIDCEFDSVDSPVIGRLHSIVADDFSTTYVRDSRNKNAFSSCRPRMNHWHAWRGGECPLPEGVVINTEYRDGFKSIGKANQCKWDHDGLATDLIAFKVTGLVDGYCWPWEQTND